MKKYNFAVLLCMGFFLAASVAGQSSEKRFFLLETSEGYSSGKWNAAVPYQHQVRIISNLFDFPSGWDASRELDVKIQFVEHVMRTNPEAIRKMRLHTKGPFRAIPHDPTNQYTKGEYTHYLTVPVSGNWRYEIILIDGFKYIPDKYKGPDPGKKSPLYTEAMKILYEPN